VQENDKTTHMGSYFLFSLKALYPGPKKLRHNSDPNFDAIYKFLINNKKDLLKASLTLLGFFLPSVYKIFL